MADRREHSGSKSLVKGMLLQEMGVPMKISVLPPDIVHNYLVSKSLPFLIDHRETGRYQMIFSAE